MRIAFYLVLKVAATISLVGDCLDCVYTHPGQPGCGDSQTEQCVCDFGAIGCCTEEWLDLCVDIAISQCNCDPPGCSDCGTAHETPGCANQDIQNCVCEISPTCCNDDWNPSCVDLALNLCDCVLPITLTPTLTPTTSPSPLPTSNQITNCCWSPRIEADIYGFGFRRLYAETLIDCEAECCADSRCLALQYSMTCAEGCDVNCILHDTQETTGPLYRDYYLRLREHDQDDCTTECGNCVFPQRTPGCDDHDIEECVCVNHGIDACCEIAWNTACSQLAVLFCGCPEPIDCGDCVYAKETPGCDITAVEDCICENIGLQSCCDDIWGSICAQVAVAQCGCSPPPDTIPPTRPPSSIPTYEPTPSVTYSPTQIPTPSETTIPTFQPTPAVTATPTQPPDCGDCIFEHSTAGCDTSEIEKCVCELVGASICCSPEGRWDHLCARLAVVQCGCVSAPQPTKLPTLSPTPIMTVEPSFTNQTFAPTTLPATPYPSNRPSAIPIFTPTPTPTPTPAPVIIPTGYRCEITLNLDYSTITDPELFLSRTKADICFALVVSLANTDEPFSCDRIVMNELREGSVVVGFVIYDTTRNEPTTELAFQRLNQEIQLGSGYLYDGEITSSAISFIGWPLGSAPPPTEIPADPASDSVAWYAVFFPLFLGIPAIAAIIYYAYKHAQRRAYHEGDLYGRIVSLDNTLEGGDEDCSMSWFSRKRRLELGSINDVPL